MASRFGYEYGMGRPTMGQPPTIADHMAQRQQYEYGQQRLYEANQAAAFQQRNDLARQQAMDEQKLETDVKRNRLGLNGLQGMLTDRYSDAYEPVDSVGTPITSGVDISVSPNAETAAAPLPQVRINPIGLGRTLKSGYQEAFDSMRPEDSISSNRLTTEEFTERERIKAEYARQLTLLKAENQRLLAAQNNTSDAARTAATIQAQDMGADKNKIGADVMTTATMVNSGKPFTKPDPIAPPAFGDDMAAATGGEKVEEEDETGKVVVAQDGRRYFVDAKTGKRTEIKGR